MAREFQKVGVVGLGTMGAGIVEVFARAGLEVVGLEPTEDAVARGREHLERSTGRAVKRGRLSEADSAALHARVRLTTDMEELADASLVVEAVPELLEVKTEIFANLDKTCGPETILATNTSSLSVTRIAAATGRPSQVVGMHFFNPAPVLKLVEVVRTVVSEPEVVDDVAALARRLGKLPVVVGDRAGFVGNALLFGYLNAAMRMAEEHFASRADIDAAMTLGAGLPMGPFALLDLIGLDTAYEVLETMYAQSRDRWHAPTPLLTQLVAAGVKGRKSGRGFYTYAAPNSPEVVPDAAGAPEPPPVVLGVEPRTVARIGVVGPARPAEAFGASFRAAGFEVCVAAMLEDEPETAVQAQAEQLAQCDLVLEAAADEPAVKRRVFAALDQVCRPGALLVTTGTLVPVVTCGAATSRPEDVVGLHPVAPGEDGLGPVLEVVGAVLSGAPALATAVAVTERLGARPVHCRDRAGRIVDALLVPYLNDAVRMVAAGYASADDVDIAMKAGCGYPQGPVEMLEDLGLDHVLAVLHRLHDELREPGLTPVPVLEQLQTAGVRVGTLRTLARG